MATVHASNHWSAEVLGSRAASVRGDLGPSSGLPSVAQNLGHFGWHLLGAVVLVVGVALVFTLWLMPVGLPLALLGMALVSAPPDC